MKSEKGITAWLLEDHTLPIITLQFVFDGGTSQDPAGKEGLANLMTGLFDEGAGDDGGDSFQVRLDDAGAEMSFQARRDGIYGSVRMLSLHRDAAFDLIRLALNRPRFDQGPLGPRSASLRHHRQRARTSRDRRGCLAAQDLRHAPIFEAARGHQGKPGPHNAHRSKRLPQGRFGPRWAARRGRGRHRCQVPERKA
ncbi:hypothetical protein [Mesorhizobium sp. ORM16]|uniref:hypothetical protein n=1 Tax=Mesorhizobium sp. ORM16 TaxID=3376989 RepID=UPI0038578862